jgi:hypothetical protein
MSSKQKNRTGVPSENRTSKEPHFGTAAPGGASPDAHGGGQFVEVETGESADATNAIQAALDACE